MAESQTIDDVAVSVDPINAPLDPIQDDSNYSNYEMMNMVQYMAKAMQRNTHLHMLSSLPIEIRRRLRALRNLQLQTNSIDIEFHHREFELEKEFQAKHDEVFKKRFQIINGEYEPNDTECDYPDPDVLQRIDENLALMAQVRTGESSDNAEGPVKGVPHFWSYILYSNPMLDLIVHANDEEILQHLIDVRTKYQSEPHFAFILEFEFSPNPFFENSILTKEYLLRMKIDDVICYEGPEIYKTTGCNINWKSERPTNETPSFLDFFSPPVLPECVMDSSYKEIKDLLESDFEIGNYIKDHIIPKATLYYTGEFTDNCDDSIDTETSEDESNDQADVVEEVEAKQTANSETGDQ